MLFFAAEMRGTMGERFVIREYEFDTKAEWEEAKREEESIGYIRSKVDLGKVDQVEKLYRKLIEKRSLITPIGMDFLQELRSSLLRAGKKEEELPPIYISLPRKKKVRPSQLSDGNVQKYQLLAESYRVKLRNARIVIAFMTIIIIAMFAVTMFGPNTPLADAEERAQDRYAAWAQELDAKEKELRAREQELDAREEELGTTAP